MKTLVLGCVCLLLPQWTQSASQNETFEPETIKTIDALEAMLVGPAQTLNRSDGPTASEYAALTDRCRSAFTMEGLIAIMARGDIGRGEKIQETLAMDVGRYYECRAYADDDPNLCRHLSWFQLGFYSDSQEELCRETYRKMTLARSIITGDPAAATLCERLYRSIPDQDGTIAEGKIPETCVIVATDPDPESVCRKRSLLSKRPPFTKKAMQECIFFQATRIGSRRYCASISGKEKWCESFALYRDAVEARSPEACGDSIVCRLLLGADAKVCGGYLDNVKTYYCRDRAEIEAGGIHGKGSRSEALTTMRRKSEQAFRFLAWWKRSLKEQEQRAGADYKKERVRYRDAERRLDRILVNIRRIPGS